MQLLLRSTKETAAKMVMWTAESEHNIKVFTDFASKVGGKI